MVRRLGIGMVLTLAVSTSMAWAVIVDSVPPETAKEWGSSAIGGPGGGAWVGLENLSSGTIEIALEKKEKEESEVWVLPSGYQLLDNTLLRITTTPDARGARKISLRMWYPERTRDRNALRRRSPILLKREGRVGNRLRWVTVDRQLRERPYRREVARRERAMDRMLGHYGCCPAGNYVWAVGDLDGDYAIGVIPEPVSLSLLAGGAGLLLWRRRR